MPDERDDEQKISQILLRDDRYNREAYRFLQEGLEYTVQRRGKRGHVTGPELLEGVRDLALVEEQIMSKQDSDTRADFANIYDFEEVFDHQTEIEIEE